MSGYGRTRRLLCERRSTVSLLEPIFGAGPSARAEGQGPISADGQSFVLREWSGSGPPYLHVHHADDEAWHILEGTLTFKFLDRTVEAPAGTTVFVPAGVAHTYFDLLPIRLRHRE